MCIARADASHGRSGAELGPQPAVAALKRPMGHNGTWTAGPSATQAQEPARAGLARFLRTGGRVAWQLAADFVRRN
jgi:hypothetical protein